MKADNDQIAVLHTFAEQFLKYGFTQNTDYQKLGFAKITACLRNFTEAEIQDILRAFCDEWSDRDLFFFENIGKEITDFTVALHRHPLVGKAAVKFFKKEKKYVRSSVFGLICQIGLISSYRYETEISKMLSSSLSKIWQFADNLETDGWIYTIIKDLQLRKIRAKFNVIMGFIKKCPDAAVVLARGLTLLSIQLIESSSRKSSINVIEGKLEDSGNDIAFIGRRLLADTISSVFIESDKKYTADPLALLVTAICSNASKIPTVYYFIDALVELRSKKSAMLVTNWEVFEKLSLNICDLPSEVGVRVMSALMPVINKREGLRNKIFESLKVQMISVSKVSTALPVMFQLLRSLTDQPETKRAFQCSQSFASFSSQLNGSQMKASSNGIVDLCKKNNYFVLHGLDLLLGELTSLPKLGVGTYVDKIDKIYYVKHPCPHLLKATLAILSAATTSCENTVQFCQSQLSQNGTNTVAKADEAIEKYVQSILNIHLEDLQLDESNVFLSNPSSDPETLRFKTFGSMIIQLYDVIIERLWDLLNEVDRRDDALVNIEKLIVSRKSLSELLETKEKVDKDSNDKKSPKAKNGKGLDVKKENLEASKLVVQDLQTDIPKLSKMLKDLDSSDMNETSTDGSTIKDVFLSWLIPRIYDSVSLLDSKSSTCLASMKSLTSMASSLLKFFSSELNSHPDFIKAYVIAQTKAVESYSKILIYILSKYEGKCAETLEEIFTNVISSEYDAGADYPQYTQIGQHVAEVAEMEIDHEEGDNIKAAGFNLGFRVFSSKHIAAYYQKILPGIFSTHHLYEGRKTLIEYGKQICSFIAVANKLSSMLTSSSNEIRKNVIKLILESAKKYKINDKNATNEFWKAALDIIARSNCDDYWMKLFDELIDCMIDITTEDNSVVYKSLKPDTASQFYVNIVRTMSRLLAKVRTAINVKIEIGDEITDGFLEVICCTVEMFAKKILKIIKIDDTIVTENEQMITAALEMLTDFYSTLNCITQQFKNFEIDGKEAIYAFDRVLGDFVDKIINETSKKFGRGKYRPLKPSKSKAGAAKKAKTDEERHLQDSVRRNKKDEKIFIRLEKEFEMFHGSLIAIEEKYGCNDLLLNLPATKDNAMRVFKIDEKVLAKVYGGKRKLVENEEEEEEDTSDKNEEESEEEEESKNGDDKNYESEEEKNDDEEEDNKSEEEDDKSDQGSMESGDDGENSD
uniref:FANCI helical domain-containing protein n=1 Tax=Panagrolaimus sp. ES5 TaxID=591445 RepID=A0AC34GV07_9BILA